MISRRYACREAIENTVLRNASASWHCPERENACRKPQGNLDATISLLGKFDKVVGTSGQHDTRFLPRIRPRRLGLMHRSYRFDVCGNHGGLQQVQNEKSVSSCFGLTSSRKAKCGEGGCGERGRTRDGGARSYGSKGIFYD